MNLKDINKEVVKTVLNGVLVYVDSQKEVLVEDTSKKGLGLSEITGFEKCEDLLKEFRDYYNQK